MTLDEAITHAEEVAEKYERHLNIYENMDDDLFRVEKNECKNCGEEHRQLADWLKELKQLRKQTKTGHWIDNHNGTISCDCCHAWFHKDNRYSYMRYCPNCGAKLEVEE